MAIYIDSHCSDAPVWIGRILSHFLNSHNKPKTLVILCIGSDCCCGDSLGPFVGSMLSAHLLSCPQVKICGSLSHPVHALNLRETIKQIKKEDPKALIIALDAAMGEKRHQAYITMENGAMRPGAGVAHALPEVGHISITGIVNADGCMEPLVLQTTSLSLVIKMAHIISQGILQALRERFFFPEEEYFQVPADFLWEDKKLSMPASCSDCK